LLDGSLVTVDKVATDGCRVPVCVVQAERFMLEMINLPDAEERLRALMYIRQFDTRLSELRSDIKVIERACDDVKMSLELKKLLRLILTLGNQMNKDQDQAAKAFTLESLLKLNEAKAFDRKTSVLHFLVQVCRSCTPTGVCHGAPTDPSSPGW
jgi:hypothetical protein